MKLLENPHQSNVVRLAPSLVQSTAWLKSENVNSPRLVYNQSTRRRSNIVIDGWVTSIGSCTLFFREDYRLRRLASHSEPPEIAYSCLETIKEGLVSIDFFLKSPLTFPQSYSFGRRRQGHLLFLQTTERDFPGFGAWGRNPQTGSAGLRPYSTTSH